MRPDEFLSSPPAASPPTRRQYSGVLGRLTAALGPGLPLASVPGDDIADALRRLWGGCAPRDVEPQPGRHRMVAELVRHEEALARPAPARRCRAAQGA